MDIIVTKVNNKIFINDNLFNDKYYCYVIGNIYNLNDLNSESISVEKKVLKLYKKYNDDLFLKLNGEYAIIIIENNTIKAVRDKLGSKLLCYAMINNEFVVTDNFKLIIKKYKNDLVFDKKMIANYLKNSYINEPYTIFKNVYKVSSGNYVYYDKKVIIKRYYDLVKMYKKNKNKIKTIEEAKRLIESDLLESIKLRTKNNKIVNVYLSAGIDSNLITSLLKKEKKVVNTYTVGFYEKERNEAEESKKIAKYLKTNHKELYLDEKKVKEIINLIPKIYGEPFADPSLIPIIYLGQNVDNKNIILVGDGADQLFCGSRIYDYYTFKGSIIRHIISLRNILKYKIHNIEKYAVNSKYKCKKTIFVSFNNQINYMLNDIKSFFSNRLMLKGYYPLKYFNLNIAIPFSDYKFIESSFKIKHKFKYYNNDKKHILKQILYDYVPSKYLNSQKKGFGIPLREWIYTFFYKDIRNYLNDNAIKEQGLFNVNKVNKLVDNLKKSKLNYEQGCILFNLYLFQLWYKEYIKDLW